MLRSRGGLEDKGRGRGWEEKRKGKLPLVCKVNQLINLKKRAERDLPRVCHLSAGWYADVTGSNLQGFYHWTSFSSSVTNPRTVDVARG